MKLKKLINHHETHAYHNNSELNSFALRRAPQRNSRKYFHIPRSIVAEVGTFSGQSLVLGHFKLAKTHAQLAAYSRFIKRKKYITDILEFKRRYRTINLKNIQGKLPKAIDSALMQLGTEVKTLNITNCSFKHKLLEVSRCFPRTENIVIKSSVEDVLVKPEVQVDPAMVQNLKTLKIYGVSSVG